MSDLWWCEMKGRTTTDGSGSHERLVESRDSDGRLLALLAVDECGECDGDGEEVDTAFGDPTFNDADRVPMRYALLKVCSHCAGRGWQPRAMIDTSDTLLAMVPVP